MPVLHHSLRSGLPIVRNCDGTVLHDGQKIRRFLRCYRDYQSCREAEDKGVAYYLICSYVGGKLKQYRVG